LATGVSESFSHVQIYSKLQAYYLSAGCCPFPLSATLSFVRFPSDSHALPKIIQQHTIPSITTVFPIDVLLLCALSPDTSWVIETQVLFNSTKVSEGILLNRLLPSVVSRARMSPKVKSSILP
jgi:hypothetical protein